MSSNLDDGEHQGRQDHTGRTQGNMRHEFAQTSCAEDLTESTIPHRVSPDARQNAVMSGVKTRHAPPCHEPTLASLPETLSGTEYRARNVDGADPGGFRGFLPCVMPLRHLILCARCIWRICYKVVGVYDIESDILVHSFGIWQRLGDKYLSSF